MGCSPVHWWLQEKGHYSSGKGSGNRRGVGIEASPKKVSHFIIIIMQDLDFIGMLHEAGKDGQACNPDY